jgi:hypothetical protein
MKTRQSENCRQVLARAPLKAPGELTKARISREVNREFKGWNQ